MERDPLRLVWRAAPGLTAALIALTLLVGLPLALVGLELVKTTVDAVAAGSNDGPARFLGWTLDLPDRLREAPLVLLPGFDIPGRALPVAAAAGLAVVACLGTLLWWLTGTVAARIGRRVHDLLVSRVSAGIASAPPAAVEEARHVAALGVEAVGRDRRALGFLPAIPFLAGATLAATVLWVLAHDVESALALLVALGVFAVAAGRRIRVRRRLAEAERAVAGGLAAALGDLARNLAAVSRHGTQTAEADRIAGDVAGLEQRADALETRALAATAFTALAMLAGPLVVLSASLWASRADALGPGEAVAGTLAAAIATIALAAHVFARRTRAETALVLAELGRLLGGVQSRRRDRGATERPASGRVELSGVATAPSADGRLAGADFAFDLPGHVALTGPRGGGARIAAALLGGAIVPSRGTVTLGGEDLAGPDPAWRASRFAFAGGETYLFPGTLGTNLHYGTPPDAPDLEARLAAAVEAAGLGRLVERRGLSGSVDPRREPELAARLLEARAALADALREKRLSDLVTPFDPELYNPHATVGENLLFGAAIGDTFREDRLPTQPFMRSLLDAEALTKPLAAMGADIAAATLEMFADLTEGPSVLAGYSLVPMADREEVERVLARRGAGQRGAAAGRDTERLLGIAMRYCEQRHRLGLLTAEIEERVVRVRTLFAERLPKSVEPAVEIFAADRVCAAASMRDNLLFGRVAQGRASAERDLMREIRTVLQSFDLEPDVARIGLARRLDPVDHGMSEAELAGVEVVRCLVRAPDNLVVEHALDHLSHEQAAEILRRLSAAMGGRGLMVALPDPVAATTRDAFSAVVRLEAGRVVADEAGGADARAGRERVA